jgi:iron complex outermembrane receptor protein
MKLRHALLITGASLFAYPAMAAAQAAPSPSSEPSYSADDIIVTARRRAEVVQDVPAVINAVNAEALADLNVRDFTDVQTIVPGLSLAANPNGVGSVSSMRGVNFDVNVSGNSATVEYYYNDSPIVSNAVLQAMYDISQIEVLRGPQGTLRGRASPSGAINITSRKPDLFGAGGYVNGTLTSLDGHNLNGAMNIPVVEGKLAVRLAGLISNDEGNRVRPYGDKDAELRNRTRSGRISVSADPFNGLLLLDFNYQTLDKSSLQYSQVRSIQDQDPSYPLPSPILIRAKDRAAVANRYPFIVEQQFETYNWQAQLNLGGQRLTYVGIHNTMVLDGIEPMDNAGLFTNQVGPLVYPDLSDPNGAPTFTGRNIPYGWHPVTRGTYKSHEIRLQNEERIAGSFDYVVGGLIYTPTSYTDFLRTATAVPNGSGGIAMIIGLPLARYQSEKEQSLFGNLTAHIGEATEISGGLRQIWYKLDSGLDIFGFPDPNVALDTKDKATIWSASIKHNFSRDFMLYASAGSSWRASTVVIGGPVNGSTFQGQFLRSDPETSQSYELGFKSSWLNNKARFNATAFYQKFKSYPYRSAVSPWSIVPSSYNPDLTVQTGLQAEQVQYVAAVPVDVKGFEAELFYNPNRNLSFSANLSYALGKIKNGRIPCTDINGDNIPDGNLVSPPDADDLFAETGTNFVSACNVNMRSSFSSPWSAAITAEYSHPFSSSTDGYLRGLYSWKGNSQNDPISTIDDVKSYGILNVFAGLRHPDGRWDLSAYAKNITNSFRVLTNDGLRTTSVGEQTLGYTNYYGITSTMPREFGVNLRVAFGSR